MSIFKDKPKLIYGIIIDILIFIFIVVTLFFILKHNKTVDVSSPTDSADEDTIITVPNVTDENTKLKISDLKNKVKNVSISTVTKLEEYNLCYYITFDNNDHSSINNSDYALLNDTILIIDENCTIYFKYESNGIYSDDVYEIKISNIKVTESTSEKVSEKDLKKENVSKNEIAQQSTSPYFIKVNYGANVVTIYTKDKDGKYTVPYKAMVCSCGTYTPKSGTYKTSNKYTWRPLIHNVYGQYATRIVQKILFHSVPYSTNKKDALLYKEYDKLGTKASEGCVRLTVQDAKWIYDNCPSGTMVEFYSNSNPGPLGKPTAQKISSVEECRNWDPTDPATNNPWHSYKKEEENPKEEVSNSIENNVTNNISNNIVNETTNNSVITNSTIENSTISNNTIVNNSTVTNNTVTNTNETTNTISNSVISNNTITNSIVNNTVTNNVVDNNSSTDSQNNAISNNTVENTNSTTPSNNSTTNNNVQNNNTATENSSTSNNAITENENIITTNNTTTNTANTSNSTVNNIE